MALTKKLPHRFRKRCESISSEQRNMLGLRAFEPLPAALLAQSLSATIFFPQDIPNVEPDQVSRLLNSDRWFAGIIREAPLWIVHNPRHMPARQQSNLMHELAHILLRHKSVGFDTSTGLPMRHDLDEDEATFLGGCLQITRRGLLWATQQGMAKSQIAEHFVASERMVAFRSNVTGIALQPHRTDR